MARPRRLLAALPLTLVAACAGGEPRRPGGGEPRRIEPEYAEPRPAAQAEPDPFSVEAVLPRSGDPARPNVKVELTVVDVVSERGLAVRAGVAGSPVRGVVRARAAISAGQARARTRTSTFVVVQAGGAGAITLTDETRRWLGPWAALEVHVLSASSEGVRLAVGPYIAPGARRGDVVAGGAEVSLLPGEAVLLGGSSQRDEREARGLGSHAERSEARDLLVLLQVDVLG